MPSISLDAKIGSLKISSYDGSSNKKEFFKSELPVRDFLISTKWNFFRSEDNNSYVKGSVSHEGECRNSLIISPYQENKLIDVRNAFIFVGDSYIEISPFSDTSNAINKGKKALSNQKINYNIPSAVFEKENLIEKDIKELKERVKQEYGIESKKIFMIDYGEVKNKIYYIKGENKEYILKFKGKNKEKAELLSRIAENIPNYFPINFHRQNSSDFTFIIGEEVYGLEEFVRSSSSSKPRDLGYFSLLGTHIGLLHRKFSELIDKNGRYLKLFDLKGKYTSESNIISFYLDLLNDEQMHKPLLYELEKIIKLGLSSKMDSFPKGLIHGDLNHSNLIWQKDNPKIIDSETIKNSVRLSEFESPLIFCGNMKKPRYIKNSLNYLVYAYNQSANVLLSLEEIMTLPFLLKYALIKNYVIRKIRRGVNNKAYLDGIKKNLESLEGDLL